VKAVEEEGLLREGKVWGFHVSKISR
jgi:hypothetical protein